MPYGCRDPCHTGKQTTCGTSLERNDAVLASMLRVFAGHRKAVSYVRFLNGSELVSASTDSTLRLWDTKTCTPVRTFSGHNNEKNFVGLSVDNDFIACGSETNEVGLAVSVVVCHCCSSDVLQLCLTVLTSVQLHLQLCHVYLFAWKCALTVYAISLLLS